MSLNPGITGDKKSRVFEDTLCFFLIGEIFSLRVFLRPESRACVEETTPPAAEETTAKPFTPDGTGTVVDNATDEDGKEFFTITTPSENVF